MAKLIEKVYGEALFELAVEEKRMDEFRKEIRVIEQVLSENPDFEKLMQHPGIPVEEKEKILTNVWEGRVSREMLGLMLLLLQKKHYNKLSGVLDYFVTRVMEQEEIGIAYVRTPMPLSQEQKNAVEKKLIETTSYRSFEMHFEEDASLIGGMVIRIGDHVLDNSVKTKLEHLSRQLYQIKLQ